MLRTKALTPCRMADSLPADPGGGTAGPLTHQPGSANTESHILELIQTETGAADLANAIKNRRVRDVLKQHGVRIQADDDVGFNSLPFELRDNIRKCLIDSCRPEEDVENLFPLAPYACINSEWRDTIEPITFQHLSFRESVEDVSVDLELFEHYVVGSRRQYLQSIDLPVDSIQLLGDDQTTEEENVDTFTFPIFLFFHCLKRWGDEGIGDGNLDVQLQTTSLRPWVADPFTLPLEQLHARLIKLPTTQHITRFDVSLWEPIDARSMLVLLSRIPALRSVLIELQTSERPANAQDYASQIECTYPFDQILVAKCR